MADRDDNIASSCLAPRKGDQLFRGDLPDWRNNACLNVMGNGDPIAYKEGYRRGAEVLIRTVQETQRNQDYLVYPIIFMYRHHIELALKRVIMRAPHLIERSLTNEEKQHLGKHRLDSLWQDLKPMIPAICNAALWSEPAREDLDGIDDYIRQLSELDVDSFSFRFPRSKKGRRSLPKHLKNINLRHFGETMGRLADYLYGLDATISYLEETKAGIEAERIGRSKLELL